ncbi:MAG: hypothetical protein QM534_08575 [Sediminibacterium sp.]|nr:hypothetical protein [Sediminibacterium sp.]
MQKEEFFECSDKKYTGKAGDNHSGASTFQHSPFPKFRNFGKGYPTHRGRAFRYSLHPLCCFCCGSGVFVPQPPRSRKITQSAVQGCRFNPYAKGFNVFLRVCKQKNETVSERAVNCF